MRIVYTACCCVFLAMLSQLIGDEEIEAPSTEISFPKEIVFEHDGEEYTLRATGTATRAKLYMNIYSVAHYMRKPLEGRPKGIFNEILRDNQTKQLTIKWVRDVNEKQMRDGFTSGFKKVLKENPVNIEPEMEKFLSFFGNDIRKGDEFNIRWFPGGYMEVYVNGEKKGELASQDFAQAFWSIYFGSQSVVNRNKLISQLKVR